MRPDETTTVEDQTRRKLAKPRNRQTISDPPPLDPNKLDSHLPPHTARLQPNNLVVIIPQVRLVSHLYRSHSTHDYLTFPQDVHAYGPGCHSAEGELVVAGVEACCAEVFSAACDGGGDVSLVFGYEDDALCGGLV